MRLFQRKLFTQLYSSTSLTFSLSSSDASTSLRIESGMKLMKETTVQAANSLVVVYVTTHPSDWNPKFVY